MNIVLIIAYAAFAISVVGILGSLYFVTRRNDDDKKRIKAGNFLVTFAVIMFLSYFGILIAAACTEGSDEPETIIKEVPISEKQDVDSLTGVIDSLENEINRLKNEKKMELEKVDSMPGDSVLLLFRKYVSGH